MADSIELYCNNDISHWVVVCVNSECGEFYR